MDFQKLRTMLDAREISARELAEAYIDRIGKYDAILHAYLHVNRDGVIEAADKTQAIIDAGEQGPLTGIPVALDDNICTADMPMTCGSRMLEGYRPPYDAAAVEKLRTRGAVFLGKLNVGEFLPGASTVDSYYGPTINPYTVSQFSAYEHGMTAKDMFEPSIVEQNVIAKGVLISGTVEHDTAAKNMITPGAMASGAAAKDVPTPGAIASGAAAKSVLKPGMPAPGAMASGAAAKGVSAPGATASGAAAVAAGLCAAALGMDAGGAAMRSAARCGVAGFRPTYGRVSRYGFTAFTSSFDQPAALAADAAGCAAIFEAIEGYCAHDMATYSYIGAKASVSVSMSASEKAKASVRATASASANASAGVKHAGPGAVGIKGLRIGMIKELFDGAGSAFRAGCDPRIIEAAHNAAKWYERAGASIAEVSIPTLRFGVAAYQIIACAEASTNLARFDGVRYGRRAANAGDYYEMIAKSRGEGFGPAVKRRILFGTDILSADNYDMYYKKAVTIVNAIRSEYDEALKEFDALISPSYYLTTGGEPTNGGILQTFTDDCAVGPSLAGLPSVTVPCGYVMQFTDRRDANERQYVGRGFPDAPTEDLRSFTSARQGCRALQHGFPVAAPNNGFLTEQDFFLPAGMTITGRRSDDFFILGLAGAFERDFERRAPVITDGWSADILSELGKGLI